MCVGVCTKRRQKQEKIERKKEKEEKRKRELEREKERAWKLDWSGILKAWKIEEDKGRESGRERTVKGSHAKSLNFGKYHCLSPISVYFFIK